MRIAFKVPARAFWLPMRALANLGRSFTTPSPLHPRPSTRMWTHLVASLTRMAVRAPLHPAPCTLHPDVDSYGRISSRQARDGSPSLALALATRR